MAESVSANAGEPLERLLDLILYAPLGLVSQLDELLPGLVETGRSRASMARTIGQFAVRTGSTQVQDRFDEARTQVDSLVRSLADLAASRRPAASPPSDPTSHAAAEAPGGHVDPDLDATLPIEGYDTLKAAEILPLLSALSAAERQVVAEHERAGRSRKTILNRLAQLEAQPER